MLVGLVGKPNTGKSTLFNALTHGSAQIANYPFTTIDPNKGVAFVTKPCPCTELKTKCEPNNSKCLNGVRFVPVNVVDVAGLVEGAHEGKGMGNQFLNDLAQADALVCVADASGKTDDEGNPAEGHDPARDVQIIERELDAWFLGVLKRNIAKTKGKPLKDLVQNLSGLNVNEDDVNHIVGTEKAWELGKEELAEKAAQLRKKSKPMIVAANKIDLGFKEFECAYPVQKTAGDAELALQKAREKGIIEYDGKNIVVKNAENPAIRNAIEKIKSTITAHGSTGVQELINRAAFELLDCIVVYPVEDEHKYANHFGKVLPDAVLLEKGSNAVDLAAKIHSDLAKGFLYAVDAKKKIRIGREQELKDGDVIKIVSAR